MSNDIAQLNLNEPDPIEWNEYQTAGAPQPPPPAGTYTLAAPDKFDYSRGNEGQLVAVLDPLTILGPTSAGYQVRFTRTSTKRYKNRNASPAGDYLKAQGSPVTPRSNQEYVDAIEATAGRPFAADLDWEVYDKDDPTFGKGFSGMDSFPDDGKGGKIFIVTNPATGNKLRANARIRRFRPVA